MIDPVVVCGGKYTFFLDPDDMLLDCQLYGEAWPAFREQGDHNHAFTLALYEALRTERYPEKVSLADAPTGTLLMASPDGKVTKVHLLPVEGELPMSELKRLRQEKKEWAAASLEWDVKVQRLARNVAYLENRNAYYAAEQQKASKRIKSLVAHGDLKSCGGVQAEALERVERENGFLTAKIERFVEERGKAQAELKLMRIEANTRSTSVETLRRLGVAVAIENAKLRVAVRDLWKILDDVDTFDDAARGDNDGYREAVRKRIKKRWDLGVTTDGYELDLSGLLGGDPPGAGAEARLRVVERAVAQLIGAHTSKPHGVLKELLDKLLTTILSQAGVA